MKRASGSAVLRPGGSSGRQAGGGQPVTGGQMASEPFDTRVPWLLCMIWRVYDWLHRPRDERQAR